tara:strand:- start:311 stop:511 length:201 start_codon:yes stop_codon:yes gene_type:complete
MTIGSLISSFENKITKYNNKGERNKIINKIRKEIQTANNKDRILTEIDSELISTLLSKIKNELNQK